MKNLKYKGWSAFALLHENFPIGRFNLLYPSGQYNPGTAILWTRFGKSYKHLERWVRHVSDRPHGLEVHLMSGPARRNHNQERFDLWPGIPPALFNTLLETHCLGGLETQLARMKARLECIITDNTELMLCGELEDNLTDKAFKVLMHYFRMTFKSWSKKPRYARCPCTEGNFIPIKTLKEIHGASISRADIYNPDGMSVNLGGEHYFNQISIGVLHDLFRAHADAKMCLAWHAPMQGAGDAGNFTYKRIDERSYIVTDAAIASSKTLLEVS